MRISKAAAVLLVVVIVCFAVVGALLLHVALQTPQMVRKICYFICVALIAVLILLLGSFLWLSRDKEANYFLFDRDKGKNIPIEDLRFAMVDQKMTLYISTNFENSEKLWLGNSWSRADRFGSNGEYSGILALKMLYDLAASDSAKQWHWFLQSSPATVTRLCQALTRCGERDLAQKLMYLKQHCGSEITPIRGLLLGKKTYLAKRMMGLVRRHIEWYYYT